MINIKKFILGAFAIGMMASCTKDLSDLNVDPNNSPSANPAQVLSSAEAFIAYTLDGPFNQRSALWAQYWTWGPGVAIGNIERYVSDGTDYDNGWTRLYNGALADLDFVEKSDAKVHAGIAKILKAYIFQSLVDHFGDVPFSEALKGASDGIFAPKYDDDQAIYNALIPLINDGIALLGSNGTVGTEDFIFQGNTDKWEKFANSLKLRILMRQSNFKDVSSDVKALISSGNFIESAGDMVTMPFTGVSGSENPMYALLERSLGNFYVASGTSMNLLQDLNDPRLPKLYNLATASNSYVSIPQGGIDFEPFTNTKANYSLPTALTYGKANPVIFMSNWEVWFLRAEAAARFNTADDIASSFASAVTASFESMGLSNANDYLATLNYNNASASDKIKLIAIQKWISMNGTQEDESWIESRRMNTSSNSMFYDVTEGVFKKPLVSVLGDGVHPSIWLYPQTEMSLNGSAPAQRKLTERVFWDN